MTEHRIHNSSSSVPQLNQDLGKEYQSKHSSTIKPQHQNLGGQSVATDNQPPLTRAKTSYGSLQRIDSSIEISHGKPNNATIAAKNQQYRPQAPRYVPNLTQFLRQEYYRRLGVYINKARKEQDFLIAFFHDYVSLENKKVRQARIEAKKLKSEQYTFQKPAIKPAQTNDDVQTKLDLEYEKFGSYSAFDIGHTVEQDLAEEFRQQNQMMNQKQSKNQEQLQQDKINQDKHKVNVMLWWYFMWGPKVKQEQDLESIAQQKNKELKETIKQMKLQGKDVRQLRSKLIPDDCRTDQQKFQDTVQTVQKKYPANADLSQTKDTRAFNQYQSFKRVFEGYIEQCYAKKIQWKDYLSSKTLIEVYRGLNQRSNDRNEEQELQNELTKFLSEQGFLLRIYYHKTLIKASLQKLNAKMTDHLYWQNMTYHEKWVNMLNVDGEHYFQQIEIRKKEAKKAEQLRLQQEAEMVNSQKKQKKFDEQRLQKLAQPLDKQKKSHVLRELLHEFPHDRVLERMVQDESGSKQIFRYPDEYDVYKQEKDLKLKKFPIPPEEMGKHVTVEAGRELRDQIGQALLEKFRSRHGNDTAQQKQQWERKQHMLVERELIKEAQDYLQETKLRMIRTTAKKRTIRTSLAQIYARIREKFFVYVVKNFPMLKDKIHPYKKIPAHQKESQVEEQWRDQERIEKKRNERIRNRSKSVGRAKSKGRSKSIRSVSSYQSEEPDQPEIRDYPTKFKRYFFRILKALIDNKRGIKLSQIKKRIKQLPTSFMTATGNNPSFTFNAKVIATREYQKKTQNQPFTLKQRVFYRQDKKQMLAQVFMTLDEQKNCTFEPEVAALKYVIDKNKRQPEFYKMMAGESGPNSYASKHDDNFKKSHPEIYKSGKLRKAELYYKQGDYQKAMSVLSEGFNIYSLRRYFEPGFREREKKEMEKKAQKNTTLKGVAGGFMNMIDKKKSEMDKDVKVKEEEKQKFIEDNLHHHKTVTSPKQQLDKKVNVQDLKETVKDAQRNMIGEDFENSKLIPVLKDAYELFIKLHKFNVQNQKKSKQIHKQLQDIRAKSSKSRSMSRNNADEQDIDEFKTIMCPLGNMCPMQKKNQYVKTVEVEDKKFCPYAHHLMELEFPESLIVKRSSLIHTQKYLKNIENVKNGIHKDVFVPADRGDSKRKSERKRQLSTQDEKIQKDKFYKKMKEANPELYQHLHSVHDLDRKMMKVKLDGGASNRSASSNNESSKRSQTKVQYSDLTVDFNYSRKFGLLKKASIMMNERRQNDAWNTIVEAVKLIREQKRIEQEKLQKIEERWKTRLDLGSISFDDPHMKKALNTPSTDEKFWKHFYLKNQQIIENPDKKAAVKMYISQVSPYFNDSQYNKNEFLNGCVEELYFKVEKELGRKANFYELLKSVQSKEKNEDEDAEVDGGDTQERTQSVYKKYRKSEKEGEENREVIVWKFDLLFPYKKKRARTPQLCKTWFPERDKQFDEEGDPHKIAETKRKRQELLYSMKVKRKDQDLKSKKEHMRTCKSAHYPYQLGNLTQGDLEDENKTTKKRIKPWEAFDKDPETHGWTPATGKKEIFKDLSIYAPYQPSKTSQKKEGKEGGEDDQADDLFNPARATEFTKPKPKDQTMEKK